MSDKLVVSTENGKIRGKARKDYHGGQFYSFSGIPYAKAPIGELRFKAPHPPESWEGIRDGSKEGPESPQMTFVPKFYLGNEDNCLNLNVYIKELPKTNEVKKTPVMVYIHGGGFIIGSNKRTIFGPRLLMTEDVVLVIINYRLGVLGFLSLNDKSLEVPGNAGLKDQVMALKWVKQNIHNFGGDPDNVTIFGQSAGSAAVHYLTLSPTTKGLFHKAIFQSGCALNLWARGRRNAADIAKLMGYDPNINEKMLLQNLQGVSAKSIINAQIKIEDPTFASVVRPFCPVIEYQHEGAFLTEDPIDIMKAGRNHQVPMIFGYTSLEGLLYEVFRKIRSDAKHPMSLEVDIPYEFNIPQNSDVSKQVTEEIKQFYYKDKDVSKENINLRYVMCSDVLFVHGIQRTIALLKKHGTAPIFVYKMTVSSSLNFITNCCQSQHFKTVAIFSVFIRLSGRSAFKNVFLNMRKKLMNRNLEGVSHGDDAFYLLSSFITPKIMRESNEDLYIQRFVKLWTNFAKESDPTPECLEVLNNIKWRPIDSGNINNILDIGHTLKMIDNAESERVEFWEKLYQKYAT